VHVSVQYATLNVHSRVPLRIMLQLIPTRSIVHRVPQK